MELKGFKSEMTMNKLDDSYKNYSVSHATLRTEDLVEAFESFLERCGFDVPEEKAGKSDYAVEIEAMVRVFVHVEPRDKSYEAFVMKLHNFFQDQAREDNKLPSLYNKDDYYLNEVLFDAMNDIAPDGCYFGSHPGDGSLFGFFEIEEDI